MANKFKISARVTEVVEIAEFTLEEGESLDMRVAKEIVAAHQAGKLSKVATRVGLPAVALQEIAEGENLSGGENVVSSRLYGSDGTPLYDREIKVVPAGKGFAASGTENDVETTIGVFPSEDVANIVAQFWRSGHLPL